MVATITPDFPIFSDTGRLSDDEVRDHVEMLLARRRAAEAGEPYALAVFLEFNELAHGLMGGFAQEQGIRFPSEEFADLPSEQILDLIIRTLSLGVPIMQAEGLQMLTAALQGLKAGHVAPLLEKIGKRRRLAPHVSAEIELLMLMWVRWQHGRGRKVSEAEAELADQVGLTPQTIRKWPKELFKVYGESAVRSYLERAEAIGRTEAAGEDFGNFYHLDHERAQELWSASWRLQRDLPMLVNIRNEAIQSTNI
jgi:hypothetical protein